ncbi:MAG: hypothetical protein WD767_01530 [Alphaproteobacteria bacterium]
MNFVPRPGPADNPSVPTVIVSTLPPRFAGSTSVERDETKGFRQVDRRLDQRHDGRRDPYGKCQGKGHAVPNRIRIEDHIALRPMGGIENAGVVAAGTRAGAAWKKRWYAVIGFWGSRPGKTS